MKKAKRGKTQITLAIMVVALAAAVGLNMKYSADQENNLNTSSKYLGQAEYVNAEVNSEPAKSEENNYFKELRAERNKTRQEAIDLLEEITEKTGLSEEEKKSAVDKMTALSSAAENEAAIETVLKAKGFKNVIAVIGEKDIDVIIDGAADNAKAAQIRDAVLSKTSFSAANIKIISANDNTKTAQ